MADEDQGGTTVTKPPEQVAAEQALARAEAGEGPSQQPDASRAGSRIMERVQRAGGSDVQVVDDEYRDSLDAVGQGSQDPEDLALATEWLLSDEQVVNTRKLRIRIGGSDEDPVYGGWVIKAIGVDVIRMAEREAVGNRAQRRQQTDGNGYDELKANLRIVAEGTVDPPVKDLAQQKGIRDPTTLLRQRFAYRSGVLTQIAGEIMGLSGFDADDVRAAGNS